MMRYRMRWFDGEKQDWCEKELDYDKALDLMLGCYRDNDMTRDMLTIPNHIKLMGDCYIEVSEVKDEDTEMVLMAGLVNMLPMGVAYDDDGNRVEG